MHPYDIDLAHRVTPRQAAEGRPKLIVCKFTRRVFREQVMVLGREVTKIDPASIGLQESDSMAGERRPLRPPFHTSTIIAVRRQEGKGKAKLGMA